MATISIRLDNQEKKELEEMCADMGMNITTFYMIYTKKALRERKIPFEIASPREPFYTESNMNQLRKADQQVRMGRTVEKSMEELEALEVE